MDGTKRLQVAGRWWIASIGCGLGAMALFSLESVASQSAETSAAMVGIADFDGGVRPTRTEAEDRTSSLFADYRREVLAREAQPDYATYVSQTGESLEALLVRVGFSKVDDIVAPIAELGLRGDLPESTEVLVAAAPSSDDAPKLDRLRILPEPGVEIVAWHTEEGWQAQRDELPVVVRHVAAASVMTDSLFASGARAGVPRSVMVRLANLFLYDVDFVRDIQRGDRFEVVYEELSDENGRAMGTGEIVFAAMSWRGGRRAKGYYRFDGGETTDVRYFDESGESAERLLLKTPIEGARVTSRFGPRRHPTLGYTKAHKGVDFGARSGTPIMAAGDGEVVRADRFGSYGNFLLIRHNGGFETAYAHLQGFGKGVRKGARVRQGEVVAYVGSTGRSTGPHLHYEVRSNGRQVNPMELDVATGVVLTGDALNAFAAIRDGTDALRSRPLTVAATH